MKSLKKNIVYILIILIATVVLFPVLAYIINSILDRELSISVLLENISFGYFIDLVSSKEVQLEFYRISPLSPITVAFWGISGFGLLMIFLSAYGPNEKSQFEQKEEYASQGTARFQTEKEIKNNYYNEEQIQGWFFGSLQVNNYKVGMSAAIHGINNISKLNSQINVVGPPGSNKTTGFVYPNMFHIPYAYKDSNESPDIIVTDPKGEILAYTGNYLKSNNYEIKIIDFLHLKYGDTVNPIAYIDEELDIMKIASGFVGAAAMKDAKSQNADPIWEQGETLLLASLISFVLKVYPPEQHTFEQVGLVLASPNIRDLDKAETLFKRHNVTGYGEELWEKFLNIEDKLRSGITGGLSIKMTLFSLSKIKKITGSNSFDFRDIGRKKDKPLAIFIQMPDEDRTFSPIINTIISMMIKTMYSTARETNSKLPNPVYMILEEIANIGRLPGIEDLLGTMRGRRIYPMMIWQDLVQMKKMFGDSWEGIIAKCDTQIYLGVNDQFTAKYVSDGLGKTTARIQGTSSKSGGIMSSSGKTVSESYSQRQLMFPDEVGRLDNSKMVVIQSSHNPFILNKTQYRFWEYEIGKPLELADLPLISRLYPEKELILEEVDEVAATESPSTIIPNIENEETLSIIETVDRTTGEIFPQEEIVEFDVPEIEVYSIEDEDEEFVFDVPDVPEGVTDYFPPSEFNGAEEK